MGSIKRQSRVFTVSFPEDLARQVDQVAQEESRNVSELLREAFRSYKAERVRRRLEADFEYARLRNPGRYGVNDVETLVDKVRAEKQRKRKNSA